MNRGGLGNHKALTPAFEKSGALWVGVVDPTHEIEAKIITSNGPAHFRALTNGVKEMGIIDGPIWSQVLYSSYYDTPDMALHNDGQCLRVRYRFDDHDINLVYAEISVKDSGKMLGNGTTIRTELEASLPPGNITLSLDPLYKKYTNNKEAIKFLKSIESKIGTEPKNHMREHFFIKCLRNSFNVPVYIVPRKGTDPLIKFFPELNGDSNKAQRAVFEYSLDSSTYCTRVEGETFAFENDSEIEREFKSEPCENNPYNGSLLSSDKNLNYSSVQFADRFIDERTIKAILPEEELDRRGLSKQERGHTHLKKFGKSSLPNEATLRHRPIDEYTLPPKEHTRKEQCFHYGS